MFDHSRFEFILFTYYPSTSFIKTFITTPDHLPQHTEEIKNWWLAQFFFPCSLALVYYSFFISFFLLLLCFGLDIHIPFNRFSGNSENQEGFTLLWRSWDYKSFQYSPIIQSLGPVAKTFLSPVLRGLVLKPDSFGVAEGYHCQARS